MALIRSLFGKPPAGTSKVSYGWWGQLHDCHKRRYGSHEFGQYLQMLFDRGYAVLFAVPSPSKDPLNDVTEIFSSRTKTVKVVISPQQIDEIDRRARLKSMSFQDVVGHCLRLGYSIAC